jgi:hypothetical protein
MKRLIILLVSVLGFSSAQAGDLLDSLSAYRYQMRRHLGVDTASTGYISDENANQFVREAIVTLMPVIRADKIDDTITTSYRQTDYSLDSTFLGVISVEWRKMDTIKALQYVPRGKWYDLKHNATQGGKNPYLKRPSFFDYDDDYLYVFPVPTTTVADTIIVHGWRKLPSVMAASDLTAIPQAYRVPILHWAVYLVARAKQKPDVDRFFRDFMFVTKNANVALNQKGLPLIEVPDQ